MAGPGIDLCQVVFDRSGLGPEEDDAIITCHVRGLQAALPDNLFPMDDAARTQFGTRLDAFFTWYCPFMSTYYKVIEYRFYALPSAANLPMGPPAKVITVNHPGTKAGAPYPSQIACSVTWKTDRRATWGRFYLPGLVDPGGGGGRFPLSTFLAPLTTAAHNLTSRSGNGGCLTVWSRKEWTHHDPQTIQADDIPDVVRSRRLKLVVNRATWGAG